MSSPSLKTGLAMVAAALLLGVLVHAHPEKLQAPAWVAYAAVGAFGVAGLWLGLQALGLAHAARWLVCVLLALMTTIPGWVAFGTGARQCTVVAFGLRAGASVPLCRGAFGVATFGLGLMLAAAVRSALRGRRVAGSSAGGP